MKDLKMIDELLLLLPYWHYKIERPLKQLQKNTKITFETYYCLRLLNDYQKMSMKQLAEKLHMSKQQVTRMVGTLESYGFILRSVCDTDRRMNQIELTKEARNYITKEVQLNERLLDILKTEFTEEEIVELEKSIQNLLKILVKKKDR